jgi:predicted transcriptional regulator
MAGRLRMGQLEARVMESLWEGGGWMTPGEVHEVISKDHPVGYTTVMTVLTRLWQKEQVQRERDGRAYAYLPVLSREEHAATEMQKVLTAAGDSSGALGHFVAALGKRELAQLRRIVAGRKGD